MPTHPARHGIGLTQSQPRAWPLSHRRPLPRCRPRRRQPTATGRHSRFSARVWRGRRGSRRGSHSAPSLPILEPIGGLLRAASAISWNGRSIRELTIARPVRRHRRAQGALQAGDPAPLRPRAARQCAAQSDGIGAHHQELVAARAQDCQHLQVVRQQRADVRHLRARRGAGRQVVEPFEHPQECVLARARARAGLRSRCTLP